MDGPVGLRSVLSPDYFRDAFRNRTMRIPSMTARTLEVLRAHTKPIMPGTIAKQANLPYRSVLSILQDLHDEGIVLKSPGRGKGYAYILAKRQEPGRAPVGKSLPREAVMSALKRWAEAPWSPIYNNYTHAMPLYLADLAANGPGNEDARAGLTQFRDQLEHTVDTINAALETRDDFRPLSVEEAQYVEGVINNH